MKSNFFSTALLLTIALFCTSKLFAQWSSNNSYIWTTDNKNVGIGGTIPYKAKLQFDNALGNKICLWANNTDSQFGIGLNTGVMQFYTAGGLDKMAFGSGSATNFTETMSFFPGTGRLALGTNEAAGSKLEVRGQDALMVRGFQPFLNMRDDNYSSKPGRIQYINGSWNFHKIQTDGNAFYQMWVGSNGNVGIGNIIPGYKLDVSGVVRASAFIVSSDRRYKTNIRTLDGAMSKIMAMRGTTYDFAEGKMPEEVAKDKQVGFIAQEMQTVMPELVKADENGMLAVNYIGVIPVLVEALKEQHEVIEEKETRIAALEAKNNELQDRLARIEAALGIAATERQKVPAAITATVSPNPTLGLVTVSLSSTPSAKSVNVRVLDSTGREIASRSATGASSVQFDLSPFPVGVYFTQVVVDGKVVSANKVQLVK
ncbi:MAG: tail fiber domain-containing protein [Phycisphaerae bacterium]|nr:tail fiber domain-containing protein [Saprospiraceae bacterium]